MPTCIIRLSKTSSTPYSVRLPCLPAAFLPSGQTGSRSRCYGTSPSTDKPDSAFSAAVLSDLCESGFDAISLPVLVPHHLAALHHKLHFLQRSHILQGIAIDRDDVGARPRLEASDLARPSQQISRIHGRSLNRLQRRKPQLHHDSELVRIQAMRIDCCVGAKGNFHPAGERVRDILPRRRNHGRAPWPAAAQAYGFVPHYRTSSPRDRELRPDKFHAPSWQRFPHRQYTSRVRWNRLPPRRPSEFLPHHGHEQQLFCRAGVHRRRWPSSL